VSLKKAHKDLDKALNESHKEGFGFGYLEGVAFERERIIELLRSVNAYGLQVVLDTSDSTYQAEKSMDTVDLVAMIDNEND
jgi:hypothetical protein